LSEVELGHHISGNTVTENGVSTQKPSLAIYAFRQEEKRVDVHQELFFTKLLSLIKTPTLALFL
jgi:hypothetical protein